MDWIKKNYEKFTLLLLSVALLGVSVFLFLNEQRFLGGFEDLKKPPFESNKMPPLETKSIDAAGASLEKPATWAFDSAKEGWLFVSVPYIVQDSNGTAPGNLTELTGNIIHPPVPNEWLLKYGLDLLDLHVLDEDPDLDGFSNIEEWQAKTDPKDKNSHPAYTTKLFLDKWIKVPFRLLFNGRPDPITYQIDTLDLHQPTQFLHMGDTIEGTKYKIVKFEEKSHKDESGIDHDDSELTVENADTGKTVVMLVGKVVDDPDSYAQFKYFWKGATTIKVKKEGTFPINPETDISYKVIDIDDNGAKITNLKTNEEIAIPKVKEGTTFHFP